LTRREACHLDNARAAELSGNDFAHFTTSKAFAGSAEHYRQL